MPFFDHAQIRDALDNQAIPTPVALAENEKHRNRSLGRRFERDNPPPYASSTESESEFDSFFAPPRPRDMSEELKSIMEKEISDDELNSIAYDMRTWSDPVSFYLTEAKLEEDRLNRYPFRSRFIQLKGSRRLGVIVRHNVKRRWEKLGVWNPDWGFPGSNAQPSDDAREWRWRWEQQYSAADGSKSGWSMMDARRLLVKRASQLRQSLRRGEGVSIIPQSRLDQDVTVSKAESFINSRPWFLFQIEIAEERERYCRIPLQQRLLYPHSAKDQVIKWWKERGDWREEFDNSVTSWKWRHESLSPEPEDLTYLIPAANDNIDNMEDSLLDIGDFTPSEIDALDAIELPTSEQPERFWTIRKGDLPPFFPGQRVEPYESARLREQKPSLSASQELSPPRASIFGPIKPKLSYVRIFGPMESPPEEREEPSFEEHEASPQYLQGSLSQSQRGVAKPPPPQEPLHRRPRKRQPQNRGRDGDRERHPLTLPRRSARVAAIKRPAEPLPSQVMPNKKPRVGVTLEVDVPQPVARETRWSKTSQPPLRTEAATGSRPGQRRPRV
jgi:hypothetical protein